MTEEDGSFTNMQNKDHVLLDIVQEEEDLVQSIGQKMKNISNFHPIKRVPQEIDTAELVEEYSTILSKLRLKIKDPGRFTIPCTIGGHNITGALCDLGASIILMPLSVCKRLGLRAIKPSSVTLKMADGSVTHPDGKLEDVLLKVGKFTFSADFVVLDYEEDREAPIILGRPFLVTSKAIIDIELGEMTVRAHGEKVTFKVYNGKEHIIKVEECSMIECVKQEHGSKPNVKLKMGSPKERKKAKVRRKKRRHKCWK